MRQIISSRGASLMAQNQGGTTHINRLIDQTSPYLLQHAHNPVDWYPWGPEAFVRARQEDKPIFLSIGYSTCHWCHVMESESFEDQATAQILNDHFIAIKVDRETRPDVDSTYMKAVQAMTGTGGWPLSVFLTPEGKPFYGGTYYPPRQMYGRPSFKQVLLAIAEAWRNKRQDLLGSAQKIDQVLRSQVNNTSKVPLSHEVAQEAFAQFSRIFDTIHGGFGQAPKFPQPSVLSWMLGYWYRSRDVEARRMVEATLDAMAAGGIYDHLGGGFHRYATDDRWLVPHFEKMLYDQALLTQVYVQAYLISGNKTYADVARDILDYVLRDMTDSDGGFYAAEDADSEGREGLFYVWSYAEVEDILGQETAALFAKRYGLTKAGNFEGSKNVLHIAQTIEEVADESNAGVEEVREILTQAAQRLLERRNTRPRPHKDDKVITAWNGLMIASMADAGAVLGEQRYVKAAQRAADFVVDRLRIDGRLMRYGRAGKVVGKGFLDDYAFMIQALMSLYEATFDARWLYEAVTLADAMIDLFGDSRGGGFFLTGRDIDSLLAREKPDYDGAVPSGNAAAALSLVRLGRLTMTQRFTSTGQKTLEVFSVPMGQSPTGFTVMIQALDFLLGPNQEIVIAGSEKTSEAQVLVDEVRRHFLPGAVVLFHESGSAGQAIESLVPFLGNLGPVDGRAAVYICEDYTCRQPVIDRDALKKILTGISGRD